MIVTAFVRALLAGGVESRAIIPPCSAFQGEYTAPPQPALDPALHKAMTEVNAPSYRPPRDAQERLQPFVPRLLEMLADPDRETRYVAARALLRSGDARTVAALTTLLQSETENVIAIEVFRGLAEYLHAPEVVPYLAAYMRCGDATRARLAAYDAYFVPDASLAEPLASLFRASADAATQGSALQALGKVGGPLARAAAFEALERPDPDVRVVFPAMGIVMAQTDPAVQQRLVGVWRDHTAHHEP